MQSSRKSISISKNLIALSLDEDGGVVTFISELLGEDRYMVALTLYS